MITREILEKHWRSFRLSTGLGYEPMSDKAYETMENAMLEYGDGLGHESPEIIRKNTLKEVYDKWISLDNDFAFIEWLKKEQ